jgi:putative drug exporter of the RND superfamily
VRSFMTPSVAALMGRWFWWPLKVRQRPVPQSFSTDDPDKRQLALF